MAYDPRTRTVTFPGFDSTNMLLSQRTAAAPAAATMGPESTYDKLIRAMSGGNISDTLSSGDKLLALSALLGSVTRGSRVTPQEVMANIRKQQLGQLETQVAVERMKANETTKKAFLQTLPENERNMVALLSDEQLGKYMIERQKGREETDAEKKLRAAGIDPASPDGQRILRNVASSQGVISVTGPAGTTYVQAADVVLGGGGQRPAAQTIPQQAIDDLRAGRGTVEQFESIFGKGTATQYLGGGSGNATGGFRGR
jgi:hypothetical protein